MQQRDIAQKNLIETYFPETNISIANIPNLREERNKQQDALTEALDSIEVWDHDIDGAPIIFSGANFFDKMNHKWKSNNKYCAIFQRNKSYW